jgi:hypothetical protein
MVNAGGQACAIIAGCLTRTAIRTLLAPLSMSAGMWRNPDGNQSMPSPKKTSSVEFLQRHEFLALVAILALAEMLLAFLAMRRAGDPKGDQPVEAYVAQSVSNVEVPLGEFRVLRSASGGSRSSDGQYSVNIIEISPSVVLSATEEEVYQLARISQSHEQRIREQIDEIIRNADTGEWAEPEMTSVRGRIQTRLNETLGMDVVQGVAFSHFRRFTLPVAPVVLDSHTQPR